jgi:putative SOS response-associated peptidase YedK
VATVNHERMPVLLADEDEHEARLNGSVEAASELVTSFPPEFMRIVQTGYDKMDRLDDVPKG